MSITSETAPEPGEVCQDELSDTRKLLREREEKIDTLKKEKFDLAAEISEKDSIIADLRAKLAAKSSGERELEEIGSARARLTMSDLDTSPESGPA